jgi:hypothetical protein
MYPLLTNDRTLTPAQILEAHKRQPTIEIHQSHCDHMTKRSENSPSSTSSSFILLSVRARKAGVA